MKVIFGILLLAIVTNIFTAEGYNNGESLNSLEDKQIAELELNDSYENEDALQNDQRRFLGFLKKIWHRILNFIRPKPKPSRKPSRRPMPKPKPRPKPRPRPRPRSKRSTPKP